MEKVGRRERERTTRENDDIFEIGKYRVGKKKSREKEVMAMGEEKENTLPVSRAMVWHPKQIRETVFRT